VDGDAGEQADGGGNPNMVGGDAFAPVFPSLGSSDLASSLIAAQQVLSRMLEQFGEWQPSDGYRVRATLVAPDLTQGLRTVNLHVAMALAGTSSAAAVDIRCDLAAGAVDIESRPDGPNNDLILRCRHDLAHCWTCIGTSMKCP
jgi:hypothetical protein